MQKVYLQQKMEVHLTQKDYEVTGLKYVPVKVKTAELDSLKVKYTVVENGGD